MWSPASLIYGLFGSWGIGNRRQSMSGEGEQQEQAKQLLHHVRSVSLKDTKTLKEHLGILDVRELMTQRADCSRMEAPELLKEVTFQDFTESLKIVANLMSIRSGARPSGSSKFIACAYPGDIDCCEDMPCEQLYLRHIPGSAAGGWCMCASALCAPGCMSTISPPTSVGRLSLPADLNKVHF